MASGLNATAARIFRITHIKNVPWILRHGLHCRSSDIADPDFVPIGNPDLIHKRSDRPVPIPPGGWLADYVPFYFTYASPMLYNIVTGYQGIKQVPRSDIVILVASLRDLVDRTVPVIFTDSHAYPQTARYFSSPDDLDRIDWTLLQQRDFKRDPDDPGKVERYQAEALVHRHLPVGHLIGMIGHTENEVRTLRRWGEEAAVDLKVAARPNWYFA